MTRTVRALALATLGLLASCSVSPFASPSAEVHRFEADYSPWKLELVWTHRWEKPQEDSASRTCQGLYESLEMTLDASRVGTDLPIDGQAVIATYEHGGMGTCPKSHRVEGTLRVLELGSTQVKARVNAIMRCPDGEPASLKGEFVFDVKIPP